MIIIITIDFYFISYDLKVWNLEVLPRTVVKISVQNKGLQGKV